MPPEIQHLFDHIKIKAKELNHLSLGRRHQILKDLAQYLLQSIPQIIKENQKDLKNYEPSNPLYDRLLLSENRIRDIIKDINNVLTLPDPLHLVLEEKELTNKMCLKKITVPLGIIGIIYEARPNVTIDTAVLAIKSGNAAILRGSSSCFCSNTILIKLIQKALKKNKIAPVCISLYPPDRKLINYFLRANHVIDVIIPRGSHALIQKVRKIATVPVIETGAGVVHTYVDYNAKLEQAVQIIINAKTQRPSVCNALDTLLIHQDIYLQLLPLLAAKIAVNNVEIRADQKAYAILKQNYPLQLLKKAKISDFGREYLSLKMSIKIVKDINEGLAHINKYSSKHSEAIISQDRANQNRFLTEVDAAAVYSNASTRFTDGAQFGLGAEIGISTQKLHARGPMGLKEITTYKWQIRGAGQIRQ
jgi:glutamate-5-semialdehyde dehydrogenase